MRVSILSAALITAAVVVAPVSSTHHHYEKRSPWTDDHSALSSRNPGRDDQHELQQQLRLPPPPSPASASIPSTRTQPTSAPSSRSRQPPARRDDVYTFYASSDVPDAITTIVPGKETGSITTTATSSTASDITRAVNYTLPYPPSPVPTAPPSPTPKCVDTTSYALSGKCLTYISNLVTSDEFTSCLPFSLLLSASASFKNRILDATRSGNYSYLNTLLAYTNSPLPSVDQCDQNFTHYYREISRKANCGAELSGSNANAVAQAIKRGFGNYAAMRTAAGLVNPKTGVYCYLEAVASERPDDLYLWQLPAGNILPATSKPTCSPCSALLMNHIGAWNANTTTFNQTIIAAAAQAINNKCGANFITYSQQQTTNNDAIRIISSSPGLYWIIVATVVSWGFVL